MTELNGLQKVQLATQERERLIREANQVQIDENIQARKQTMEDLKEGTRLAAEARAEKQQKWYEEQGVTPPTMTGNLLNLGEAEELRDLREKAEYEDAKAELEALRKRFATEGGTV